MKVGDIVRFKATCNNLSPWPRPRMRRGGPMRIVAIGNDGYARILRNGRLRRVAVANLQLKGGR